VLETDRGHDQRVIEHLSAADFAGCRTTEIMSPWIDACEINQAFGEQGRASTDDEDKLSTLAGFAGQAGIPALSLGPYGLLELQIPLIAYPPVGLTRGADGPNEILERLMPVPFPCPVSFRMAKPGQPEPAIVYQGVTDGLKETLLVDRLNERTAAIDDQGVRQPIGAFGVQTVRRTKPMSDRSGHRTV
jgi:hypothetical protein